ncbi:MAG: hypothetical protein ACOCUH_00205 [Bacteriovoracia bacterium]
MFKLKSKQNNMRSTNRKNQNIKIVIMLLFSNIFFYILFVGSDEKIPENHLEAKLPPIPPAHTRLLLPVVNTSPDLNESQQTVTLFNMNHKMIVPKAFLRKKMDRKKIQKDWHSKLETQLLNQHIYIVDLPSKYLTYVTQAYPENAFKAFPYSPHLLRKKPKGVSYEIVF